MKLGKRILSYPLIANLFDCDCEMYLVGGYVRDIFRGVESSDLDVVVKGDFDRIVSSIALRTGGRAIVFRKGGLVRVVVNEATIDFTELQGTLEDDLSRRDFTINAIAWSPERGIIDPLKGISDIKKGIIKAVSKKNLEDDPLRLLRAYRLSGELGWEIDSHTRRVMRELRGLIKLPAIERITLEFFKLLNSGNHLDALRYAFYDGMLKEFLAFGNEELQRNFKVLSKIDAFLKKIPETYYFNFEKPFSQELTYGGLLRAEILLFDANLEDCLLSLSSAVYKRVTTTGRLMKLYRKGMSGNREKLFEIFFNARDCLMDFAILTGRKRIIGEAVRFLNLETLLQVEQITKLTGVKGGPELGRIIREIKRQQYLGRIVNEKETIRWLSNAKKKDNFLTSLMK